MMMMMTRYPAAKLWAQSLGTARFLESVHLLA